MTRPSERVSDAMRLLPGFAPQGLMTMMIICPASDLHAIGPVTVQGFAWQAVYTALAQRAMIL